MRVFLRNRLPGREAARDERGASSLELALLTPVLLLTIMLVIQFAFAFHARHVALAAAQEGARVARAYPGDDGGWQALSQQRARQYVRQIGSRLIENWSVTYIQDGDARGVEVRGDAVRVVPFLTFRVVERSVGPRECFRPDVGGGVACGHPMP